MLRTLLDPMDLEVQIQILEGNASASQQNKGLSLHKVMTNFPTGSLILDGVATAVVARRTDLEQDTKLHQILNDAKVWQQPAENLSLDQFKEALQPMRDISKKYFEASPPVCRVY